MSILLLGANLIIGASAIITTFPSNKVAVAGSQVILECRTNTSKKLVWQRRLLDGTDEESVPLETLFTGNKFTNDLAQIYGIIRDSFGQFDLNFNATLNHSNEYTCIEPGGYNFSSQIIVLASEPKCYVNGMLVKSNPTFVDEEESVELKCNLTFAGRWSPSLQWTQRIDSESDWMIIVGQEETKKGDNNIYFTSTTLSFNATNNETSFMCTTLFLESERPKSITAENIPEYSHNWTSPTFVLRSFYEPFRMNKEDEHKDENIEMKGLALVSLILAVLLLISVVATITVTLHFTVCRKKASEIYQGPTMFSLGNVVNAVSTSIGNGSEETPTSKHAYEEVDLESCSSRIVVVLDHTTERIGLPADDKYSSLVKSDMTPPKPHNYETVNLSEMADDSNAMNARPQSEHSDVRMEGFPDYVNALSDRLSSKH